MRALFSKKTSRIGGTLFAALFLSIFISVFVLPQSAYAVCPEGTHDNNTGSNYGLERCVPDDPNDTTVQSTTHAADTTPSPGVDVVQAGANIVLGGVLAPVAILMWVIFKISSLILGLAGLVFNWTIAVLVFEFAKYLGNSPGMLVAWGILRDFGNIGLLFGFVFMGISTILDLHSYPWKKALPNLVIFAVLLNFSLFAAEAVIDATNVLASTLYEQTNTGQGCHQGADWLGCVVDTGIAGQLLERVNIVSVYDNGIETTGGIEGSINGALEQFTNPLGNILKFVGLSLVTTIAAVVLFAGAFMLISRAVVLAFLMVTSPIGFAGMAIPGLTDIAHKWWDKLINQALFAPVFLLLLLVALKMTDGLNQLASANGLAAALSVTDTTSTGSILLFLLIMGFMIGALMMAKEFSIAGASFAVNSASSFVFGATARGANLIAGGSAYGLRKAIMASPFKRNPMARGLVMRGLLPVEKTNMDIRRIPGVAGMLGAGGITSGAAPAEHALFKDAQHIFDDGARRKAKTAREEEYEKELKTQKLEEEAHGSTGTLSDESAEYLNSLSEEEVLQLHGIKNGVRAMAKNLSPEMFEKIMNSKELDAATKQAHMDGRFEDLMTAVTARDHEAVRKVSKEDLVILAKRDTKGKFRQLIDGQRANGDDLISEDQYDALVNNKQLGASQRAYIARNGILGRVEQAVASRNDAEAARLALTMKPKRKAKLGRDELLNAGVISTYDDRDLTQIAAADKIDNLVDRQAIRLATGNPAHRNAAVLSRYFSGFNAQRYWG